MSAAAFSNQPQLGYGIYTATDVARILRLPKSKVRRWLKDYWDMRLAPQEGVSHSWGKREGKSINFYALVEFYVFYALRQHGVSMSKILKAYELLRSQLSTDYPFASYRIMTDSKSVLFSPDDGESIVDINEGMQYQLKEIIENFLSKIDFDDKQTALRLYPGGREHAIIVDPHHQFGQPVVNGTNVSAEALYAMFKGGEDVAFIARIYNLNTNDVEKAIQFYQSAA